MPQVIGQVKEVVTISGLPLVKKDYQEDSSPESCTTSSFPMKLEMILGLLPGPARSASFAVGQDKET